MSSTVIAKIVIYSVLQSHLHRVVKNDFPHDFAGKGVLNILGEVLTK